MPTVIATSEVVDFAEIPYSWNDLGQAIEYENVAIKWDLILSNHDTFQVRLHVNEDIPWTHNLNIGWVFNEQPYDRRWGTFVLGGEEQDASEYIPGYKNIHFMLRVFAHSTFDVCEECGEVENLCQEAHIECVACEEVRPERNSDWLELENGWGNDNVILTMCAACEHEGIAFSDVADYLECDDECGTVATRSSTIIEARRVRGYHQRRNLCEGCTEEYSWCDPCNILVWRGDAYYNEHSDEWYCEEHIDEGLLEDHLFEWNYRPPLVFHPAIPVNPLKPLYIGMELEVQWTSKEAQNWINRVHDEYSDLLYCKSDSSIEGGFEVVTHPMSPAWALENFPFDLFQEAIDLGATPKHHSCGTHIHIDKASLTTAQMWKLLQVHMKLKKFCGEVGGRGTDASYAQFGDSANIQIKENMLKIARDKGEAFGSAQRYVAVNVQNEQTLELRYMEGSITPDDIQKNIEWVHALYEFTDQISVRDIKGGALDDPGFMLGFILEGDYPSLVNHLTDYYTFPKTLERSLVCA